MTIHIIKHGAPFIVRHENRISSGASQSLSLSESISHIRNSSEDYEKINFICCYSANGGPLSNAQMLANASGRLVTGYHGKVNNLTANLNNSGHTFHPQHKFTSLICSVGNRLLSCPFKIMLSLKSG